MMSDSVNSAGFNPARTHLVAPGWGQPLLGGVGRFGGMWNLLGSPVPMGRGSGPPLPSKGGSDTALTVQVAMNDLSPAGPIQAVEILMESPSLAHMSRTHHAVIRRIQVPPEGRGDPKVTSNPLEWSLACSGGHFCGTMV